MVELMKNEIANNLSNGGIIFLDKDCKHEHIRHSFYMKPNNFGYSFYHIRVSSVDDKITPSFKDFKTINVEKSCPIDDALNSICNEIDKYIGDNGYEISCDGRVA